MLSLDYLSDVFDAELCSLLDPQNQQGRMDPSREIGLFGDIWDVPVTSQQPRTDLSTHNSMQPLPIPETGDNAEGPEGAPMPQRRGRDPGRSSVGQNPYGRNGTLRCELCRHWRKKASSTVL